MLYLGMMLMDLEFICKTLTLEFIQVGQQLSLIFQGDITMIQIIKLRLHNHLKVIFKVLNITKEFKEKNLELLIF